MRLTEINVTLDGVAVNVVAVSIIWSWRAVWYTHDQVNTKLDRMCWIELFINGSLLFELGQHDIIDFKCRPGRLCVGYTIEGDNTIGGQDGSNIGIENRCRSRLQRGGSFFGWMNGRGR